MSIDLIPPTIRLHSSWLESRDEWGGGEHQAGASVWRADQLGMDLDQPDDFARWVELLLLDADPTAVPPEGLVPSTTLWVVEDDTYLGAVHLRHRLNDYLAARGGHIGYGIRPSARRRGLATLALREALVRAGRLGLDQVLITCDDDNSASARTIERCGGRLITTVPATADDVAYRRYAVECVISRRRSATSRGCGRARWP